MFFFPDEALNTPLISIASWKFEPFRAATSDNIIALHWS